MKEVRCSGSKPECKRCIKKRLKCVYPVETNPGDEDKISFLFSLNLFVQLALYMVAEDN